MGRLGRLGLVGVYVLIDALQAPANIDLNKRGTALGPLIFSWEHPMPAQATFFIYLY